MDRPEALLVVFTGELRIDDLHIVGKNLVDDSGLSVRGGVMVGSDATFYFDGDTFLDGTDVSGLAAAPGNDIVPGGLDDRCAVLSFVSIVRGKREMRDFIVSYSLDPDVSDISPQFDFVQLFHD